MDGHLNDGTHDNRIKFFFKIKIFGFFYQKHLIYFCKNVLSQKKRAVF